MQIHEERQVQHAASNGLQRPTSDYFVIDRAAFNQGENAKYGIEIRGGVLPDTGGERSTRGSYVGTWTKVGALCATDYKWIQEQQVAQGKIIPVIR